MGKSYPFLTQIKDPAIQQALRLLFDQVAAIKTGSQPAQGNQDIGGNRVRRLADPVDDDDAVHKRFVMEQIDKLRQETKRRGVQNFTGQLAEPQIPRIIALKPGEPLPNKTTALPYMMVRRAPGDLVFFDPAENDWVAV